MIGISYNRKVKMTEQVKANTEVSEFKIIVTMLTTEITIPITLVPIINFNLTSS